MNFQVFLPHFEALLNSGEIQSCQQAKLGSSFVVCLLTDAQKQNFILFVIVVAMYGYIPVIRVSYSEAPANRR